MTFLPYLSLGINFKLLKILIIDDDNNYKKKKTGLHRFAQVQLVLAISLQWSVQ